MINADFLSLLFGNDDLILNHAEADENTLTLFMELKRKEQPCPSCGCLTKYVHDYRTQKIKELSAFGKDTILFFRKRRYRCLECGKRFFEQNSMLTKYSRMTNRLIEHIYDKLKNEYSFSSVAREVKTSVNTVIRIFDREAEYPIPEIGDVVSIDEFKGNTGKEKYQCIVADPKKHCVLDILPDRFKKNVSTYFKQQLEKVRNNVHYFISDMWKPYADTAKEVFQNATQVVDKYHWIRQVIWAFEDVRKKAQKNCTKKQRLTMKHSRTLLNKRYVYLSQADKKRVDDMLSCSDELKKAHELKEAFFSALDSKDSNQAVLKISSWLAQAIHSSIKAFESCAYTLYQWKEGILNSFDCKYTNGFAEGCNNKIKVLKRNAYGYRNFDRFRNRILHMFSHQRMSVAQSEK